MSEWKVVEFQTLAHSGPGSFSIGPFGSAITTDNYVPTGVPVVRGVNLARGVFVDDKFVYISDEKADELSRCNLVAGDLVFTHRGTIGQVSMIPRAPRFGRYVLSSSQVKARLDTDRAVPEFYYYWFRSPEGQRGLLANASIVGVPGIGQPLATIKALQVPCPPTEAQKAVSNVLGAMDDKIVLNDQITGSVNFLIRALFAQVLASGSRFVTLGGLVEFKYGKALKEERRRPGRVPVFGGNGVSGWHDTPLVNGPGVIVGRKGANAGSVSWSQGPFWPIDTSFYVIPLGAGVPLEFIFFLLESSGLRNYVGDSAIPGLNREMALSLQMKIPDNEVIFQFVDSAKPLLELIAQMTEESRALAELRDTLLPKLMSGEIRVRDAERVVEDVT